MTLQSTIFSGLTFVVLALAPQAARADDDYEDYLEDLREDRRERLEDARDNYEDYLEDLRDRQRGRFRGYSPYLRSPVPFQYAPRYRQYYSPPSYRGGSYYAPGYRRYPSMRGYHHYYQRSRPSFFFSLPRLGIQFGW